MIVVGIHRLVVGLILSHSTAPPPPLFNRLPPTGAHGCYMGITMPGKRPANSRPLKPKKEGIEALRAFRDLSVGIEDAL